jgi:phosphopantothenate-cysteine ligase
MAEHKIQSSEVPVISVDHTTIPASEIYTGENEPQPATHGKKLVIDLDPVPKFLHHLVDGWAPDGSMIVSFKLETDPRLLVYKARTALERYAHHLVIGNLLSTRKWEVVFVTPDPPRERWIRVPKSRRSKSISGVETQVGLAEGKSPGVITEEVPQMQTEGTGADADQSHGGRPPSDHELEIESMIVPELIKMHSQMIEKANGGKA